MNREQILEFLNSNPVCHLATCEGSQPRVRGMMMYRADSWGLVFHTGKFKALSKQLLANKQVEVCFNSQDTQVRVVGVAEIVEDMGLKEGDRRGPAFPETLDREAWVRPACGLSSDAVQGCDMDHGDES